MRAFTPLVFAGLALAGGLVPGQEPKPAGPPDVPALVRDLGSPDYSVREAATAALGKTPAAFGPLHEAATDRDPEVAKRAGQALRALRRRLGPARLKRLPEYARARQVDRLVEAMVAWPEAVTYDDRDRYRTLARDIVAWARKEFGPDLPESETDLRDVDRSTPGGTPLATGRDLDGFANGDTVADGIDMTRQPLNPYRYRGAFVGTLGPGGTLQLVNGDVTYGRPSQGGGGFAGLFVGNGDLTTDWAIYVNNAVVLCTGDVRFGFKVINSLVVAGGDITFTMKSLEESAREAKSVFRPKEPKLAGFLKFYDCAAEGLHVRADGASVFVTKVDDGRPFATAGIQAGDRIVKVDGKPVRSVRELNRLLCRAEVGYPGTAAVFLARGEKGVDAAVKLAEPPTLDP